uniref:Potassium channel inwardly rectifying transmembrane domain-containing protein n=1 Tax=Ditylenchus dipsaci TaxID=166011 RepID=A0A915DX27_9BILA
MSGVDGKTPLFLAVNNHHHHNNNSNSAPSAKTKLLSASSLREVEECCAGKSAPARLVAKDGSCLIRPIHMPNHYFTLYRNWFHLLIENSWRAILFVFASGFVFSWLFFGLLYYIIALWSRSDDQQNQRAEHHQCIANVQSFVSAFLFSMESQHTIGYGTRYMTEMCPQAFAVLCVQLIVLRPKKRKQEMRFSKRAVVGWSVMDEANNSSDEPCKVPNYPILMIRLADIQHRLYLAESHVKLYMASTKSMR